MKDAKVILSDLLDRQIVDSLLVEYKYQDSLSNRKISLLTNDIRQLQLQSDNKDLQIENLNKILKKISKLDICHICKSKITPKHMGEIREEIVPKIESLRKEIENADKELKIIYQKKEILIGDIEEITQQISKTESAFAKEKPAKPNTGWKL